MWRLLAVGVCLVAFTPFAPAQTADQMVEGGGLKTSEPFGTLNGGRPLPPGAFARLGSPRMRTRAGYANGLQFSPDGRRLVVAAGGDDLWWFDCTAGKAMHRHEYPTRGIKCGRLLDDGTLVLFHTRTVGDADYYHVSRFDPTTGKMASAVKTDATNLDEAAFDPQGKSVVVVKERTVSLFDAKTGERRWTRTLKLSSATASVPTFFADGSKLLVGELGRLAVHDAKTGEVLVKLESAAAEESGGAATGIVSADGLRVAAATRSDFAVWDAQTGQVRKRFPRKLDPLGFHADGRRLIATTGEEVGILFNLDTEKVEHEFPLPPKNAALSADGKRLAVSLNDAVVQYDIPATGLPTLAAQSADVPGLPDDLQFEADGTLVGRLPGWGGWVAWKDRKPEAHLFRPPAADAVLGLSADRQRVLRIRGNEFLVSGLDGHAPATFKHDLGTSDVKFVAALSADGAVAVAAHNEGLTRFDMSTRTARLVRSPFKERGAGTVAAISADGRVAATEGYDPVSDARYVEVYSLATNQVVRTVPLRGPAERIVLTPDGRRLAVAFATSSARSEPEKNLIVLDPLSWQALLKLGPIAKGDGVHVALSPDGRTAAWHASGELRVYELVTGQLRAKLPTPKNDLHAVALAGDGFTLAAAAPGWPVALWDIAGESKFTGLRTTSEWDDAWAELVKPDSLTAYQAARRMKLNPAEAVTFLKKKLTPTGPPDPAVLAKWLNRLDAPAFADRQEAAKQLRGLGELAVPELNRLLETTDSAEVRQRIESLLTVATKPTPEAVRGVRAVEVLEWLGTADARAVLKALAAGAEGSRQTQEAVAALGRMK